MRLEANLFSSRRRKTNLTLSYFPTPESEGDLLPASRAVTTATPTMSRAPPLILISEYDGFITGATLDINGGVYGC